MLYPKRHSGVGFSVAMQSVSPGRLCAVRVLSKQKPHECQQVTDTHALAVPEIQAYLCVCTRQHEVEDDGPHLILARKGYVAGCKILTFL